MPNPHFTEEDIFLRRREILNRLSSLINQGRIYYDNLGNEEQHQGEYPVDTGYRPVILDPLVAAYRVLISLDDINLIPDSELAVRIENWRKFQMAKVSDRVWLYLARDTRIPSDRMLRCAFLEAVPRVPARDEENIEPK